MPRLDHRLFALTRYLNNLLLSHASKLNPRDHSHHSLVADKLLPRYPDDRPQRVAASPILNSIAPGMHLTLLSGLQSSASSAHGGGPFGSRLHGDRRSAIICGFNLHGGRRSGSRTGRKSGGRSPAFKPGQEGVGHLGRDCDRLAVLLYINVSLSYRGIGSPYEKKMIANYELTYQCTSGQLAWPWRPEPSYRRC